MARAVRNPIDRYWEKVNKRGPGDCWEWTKACFDRGYGAFRLGGKQVKAHRFGYELAFGPIPDGLYVLHRCDNPPCQNPGHFFLGTHKDNAIDRERKARGRYRTLGPIIRPPRPRRDKVTAEDVATIRRRYSTGETQAAIASDYNLTQVHVGRIVNRVTWKDLP